MSLSTHRTLVVPLSVRQVADFAHGSPVSNGSVRQMADFAHGVLRGSYGPGHGPMRRNRFAPVRRKDGIPCNSVTCPRP